MDFIKTKIPEVIIIKPKIFEDERGYFFESFRKDLLEKFINKKIDFVQDAQSKSTFGVLRGLHYQLPPFAQAKIVRVLKGKILDIAVDIRKNSPTFGKYISVELSEDNKKQLFIPRGFAHGFATLSNEAVVLYKMDNYYSKEHERGIIYDDAILNIDWKLSKDDIILSQKDKLNTPLNKSEFFDF